MFEWLRRKRAAPASEAVASLSEALPPQEIVWRPDTSLPIPDWNRQAWPELDEAALHGHANALAASWVDAMRGVLSGPYTRSESDKFMLLSALAPRPAQVLLEYLERARKRVLATLAGIAADAGYGKIVVLVLGDQESYYSYIANYGRESSRPEAFSGGMFIDAGYGHFVFVEGPFESMEPVVVHELTHCLVRHLEIPAWLNEGLAVNTEHRFVQPRPRYRPNELQYLFSKFWNESSIQEFWSGKSFVRADDGQPLSYELARLLVQLLDRDYELLAKFCAAARAEDGGEDAAATALGMSLQELAAAVLGPGPWKPQPASWEADTDQDGNPAALSR